MCGIVGFIGNEAVEEWLLLGLERLEYRGYDSCGISVLKNLKEIITYKDKGRVSHLRSLVRPTGATIGIGHTRWATHGIPNYINSHPHLTNNNRFSIVHNGVIENEEELKNKYLSNIALKSDTDTEIVAEMISLFYEEYQDMNLALEKIIKVVKGSYAIVVIDSFDNNRIYAIKNKSPLLIGLGTGFNMVASDALAMIDKTHQFVNLKDQEYAIIRKDKTLVYDKDGKEITYQPIKIEYDETDVEKGLYEHYMLKEIDEQPSVIRKIIQKYQIDNKLYINKEIINAVKEADRIYFLAAGTSYHAGLIAKNIFEKLLKKEASVFIASEFNYDLPLLSSNPIFIIISQSGETADCRTALQEINQRGYKSITITNVANSTLYRESTYQLLIYAGREIAVASTKAYTASIAVLAILAFLSSDNHTFDMITELSKAANIMDSLIDQKEYIQRLSKEYLMEKRNCFFIGRNLDYAIALEGALKLKEISYIQAEGFAAGELKHGTIALIEKDTPVIVLISQSSVNLNTRSNSKEVEARGGKTLFISFSSLSNASDQIKIMDILPILSPLVMIIPLQLIAYYAALERGLDIDKPRNLAKSVTVE